MKYVLMIIIIILLAAFVLPGNGSPSRGLVITEQAVFEEVAHSSIPE